ncbi:MAG TPA: HPr family phosphocarrier protein [bacterium]|jgi:phosphocarrier protein HPr|nr:HPr family phosphocarrier protein [bacterium]
MEITKKVKILNRLGFHLRAAAQFVKTSCKFKCRILVKGALESVDGKSLLNLMTLAASYGSELTIVFQGEDARDACNEIQNLFLTRFGEKD